MKAVLFSSFCFLFIQISTQSKSKSVGCGRQAPGYLPRLPTAKHRVINGDSARPHSWPWMVSLRTSNGTWHFCGGSLQRVSKDKEESDIVLTAAHCVPIENGTLGDFSYMTVVAGTNMRPNVARSASEGAGEESRKVQNIQFHEGYKSLVNDLAILQLETPIRFSDTIRPVCMPKDNEKLPIKKTCVAAGWGRDDSNSSSTPDYLQQVVSPVHSKEMCRTTWTWKEDAWNHALICAGPLDGSSAVCNGDSGGPLVCKNFDGSWVQHGVASFVASRNCTKDKYPPVFVKVSTYTSWIRQKINAMSSLLKKG